jgi:hypothetical protein
LDTWPIVSLMKILYHFTLRHRYTTKKYIGNVRRINKIKCMKQRILPLFRNI